VGTDYLGGQFTAACLSTGTSSFADFLAAGAPDMLPGARAGNVPAAGRGGAPFGAPAQPPGAV
jgi:hypothetical protein